MLVVIYFIIFQLSDNLKMLVVIYFIIFQLSDNLKMLVPGGGRGKIRLKFVFHDNDKSKEEVGLMLLLKLCSLYRTSIGVRDCVINLLWYANATIVIGGARIYSRAPILNIW